jgi:uncharacterized membrane protein YdjX (TVP38/TMEM64 family)
MPKRTVRPKAIVIASVHDYRVGRRGSIQAIADALARRGFDVLFLSIRFSLLSFSTITVVVCEVAGQLSLHCCS